MARAVESQPPPGSAGAMILSCLPPSVSLAASDGPPRDTVTATSTTAIAAATAYGAHPPTRRTVLP